MQVGIGNSRNIRPQMLKHQDQRSGKETISDSTSNNSTLQELITNTKEEAGGLRTENRTLKTAIELPIGGSSTDLLEGRTHRSGPVIRQRGRYS